MTQLVKTAQINDNTRCTYRVDSPTLLRHQSLCATKVTLDGKPATVTCASHKFAVVCNLDGTVKLEWTWDAVERIVASGGKFQS